MGGGDGFTRRQRPGRERLGGSWGRSGGGHVTGFGCLRGSLDLINVYQLPGRPENRWGGGDLDQPGRAVDHLRALSGNRIATLRLQGGRAAPITVRFGSL